MTDYNNGKWHGWNGGECPVHPRSVVEVCPARGEHNPRAAEFFEWDYAYTSLPIRAFRVVKPYREPRVFWAVDTHLCQTQAEAEKHLKRATVHYTSRGLPAPQIIKLVEVLE